MLRIYDTVIALLKLLGPVFDKIAERDPDLARQGRRAASSIALNIAEGAGVRAGNRRSRYRTALGSALEVRAVLDIAEALGMAVVGTQIPEMLRNVVGVLVKCT